MSTASFISITNAQDADWEHAHARSEASGASTPSIVLSDEEDVVSVTVSSDAGEDDEDAWEGIYDTDSDAPLKSSSVVRTPQSRPALDLVPDAEQQQDDSLHSSFSDNRTAAASSTEVLYTFPDPLSTSSLSLEADQHSHLTLSEADTDLLHHLDAESTTLSSLPPSPKHGPVPTSSSPRSPLRYATGIALASILIAYALQSYQLIDLDILRPSTQVHDQLAPKWSDALLHSIFGTSQPPSPVFVPSSVAVSVPATASSAVHIPATSLTAPSRRACKASRRYTPKARDCEGGCEEVSLSLAVQSALATAEIPLLLDSPEPRGSVVITPPPSSLERYDATPLALSPLVVMKSALSLALQSASRFLFYDIRDAVKILNEILASLKEHPVSRSVLDFIRERHARARRNAKKSMDIMTNVMNGNKTAVLQDAILSNVAAWKEVFHKSVDLLKA